MYYVAIIFYLPSYFENSAVVACVSAGLISQVVPFATRMWANAQPDGRPAKHRWRPLFNAAKFG